MPFAAIVPALTVVVGDALTATGAIVNCEVLHKCSRSVEPESILSRINMNIPGYNNRRQDVGLCNVPQYNFDICQKDLKGVVVQTSLPGAGEARFENIPATCMDLATVLTGACGADGPTVTVCGSDCLAYMGLTDDQLGRLSKALSP
ncbi:hypothetical protein F4808DRAFT_468808 [Astrocystis sublimbata]|nr:hypothetical protein F4808DRAFT_468808 [Astrocystis sublimbata]